MKTFTYPMLAACVLAAACLITACSTYAGGILTSATFTMLPGDVVAVGPNLPSLRYERANDSRCPPDVECIWAGTIVYEFTLLGAIADEQFSLSSEHPRFDSILDPKLHITLAKFDPPPVPPSGEPKPVHPVTITVERDN